MLDFTTLVLIFSAWTLQDDPGSADAALLGPAQAETALKSCLETVTVQSSEAASAFQTLEALARKPGVAALDLRRALIWSRVTLVGDPATPPPELPRSPGLLLVIARELPVPTPTHLLDAIAGELGTDASRDLALLELIAKTRSGDCLPFLRRIEAECRRQLHSIQVHAQVLTLLGRHETIDGLTLLDALRRSAEQEIRYFADLAFREVINRERRRERREALSSWYLAHADQHLTGRDAIRFRLSAAELQIQDGEAQDARSVLQGVAAACVGSLDTDALVLHAEACLGLAWTALLSGDRDEARAALEQGLRQPRPALEREDPWEIALARIRLVRALFEYLNGEGTATAFARQLENLPSDPGRNLFDAAYFGRFGPFSLTRTLRSNGQAENLRRALRDLVGAIEATSPLTGFGLLEVDQDRDEAPASWIFLQLADLTLHDAALPEQAGQLLEARLESLRGMRRYDNLQLLVETELLRSQTLLHRFDAAAARQAADAACAIAHDLNVGSRVSFLEQLDRDQPPTPPAATRLLRAGEPFGSLLGKALITRANVRATLEDDRPGAARDLHQARRYLVWSTDQWLSTAIDFSRRGFRELGARALACSQSFPDALYNRACAEAHLGLDSEAVANLGGYLRLRRYTPLGRDQEARFMARDSDLEPIWGAAEFPRPGEH